MACVYVEKSTSVDGSLIFATITGLLSTRVSIITLANNVKCFGVLLQMRIGKKMQIRKEL